MPEPTSISADSSQGEHSPVIAESAPPNAPAQKVDTAELEQAIHIAQSAAADLGNAPIQTPIAAPVPTPPSVPGQSAAPTAPEPSLAEIDQALAADLDNLLQGDFETIDAVLDGVFEQQAALVQKPDGKPATPPPRLAPDYRAPDKPVAQKFELEQSVDAPHVENTQAAGLAAEPVPPANVAASAGVAQEPSPTPVAVASPTLATPAVPQAPSQPQPAAAAATVTEVAPVEPAPAAPNTADQANAPTALESTPTAGDGADRSNPPAVAGSGAESQPRRARMPRFKPRAVMKHASVPLGAGLLAMNLPMRFVPARLRTFVNWAAISLLAWVPIVWIMALTVGKPSARDRAPENASESTSSTLHDESTNNAKPKSKPKAKSQSAKPVKDSHGGGH